MAERKTSPYLADEWTVPQLLIEHRNVGIANEPIRAELQGAIQAKLTDQLVASIDRHEQAASRLSRQVLILNVVLGLFTVAGTVLTIIAFVR